MEDNLLTTLRMQITQNTSQIEMENFCRKIILREVLPNGASSEHEKIVEYIIKHLSIPVRENRQELIKSYEQQDMKPVSYAGVIGIVACAIIYLIAYELFETHLVGIILGVVGGIFGMRFASKTDREKTSSPKTGEVQTNYKSVKEIANIIDEFILQLRKLLDLFSALSDKSNHKYPLEEIPYISVLRWLNTELQRSKDDENKVYLSSLLDQCGYELVDYSVENGDMFDKSSAYVQIGRTVAKAVVNKKTKDCIISGKVVFPMIRS